MVRQLVILFLAFFLSSLASAQKQANIWYFGKRAGISFNTSPPSPLTDGQMEQYEGTACIADEQGNLVLYTNGISVWNNKHELIADDLYGNVSSSQSALIVPHPAQRNIYYIFTVDAWENFSDTATNKGLNYSIIDINLKQGKGGLVEKNQLLFRSSTEKLTAVSSSDCKSIWVITHPFNSDEYWVYTIDEQGLNPVPVISKVGRVHKTRFNSAGQLKVSPDGKKLACAIVGGDFVSGGSLELFR